MNDGTIFEQIERLSEEELALEEAHPGKPMSEAERVHLREVEVQLDQCYDLLRQRRARRAAGLDPDDAALRSATTVEGYLQ
ncbi:MAG TPA: DUF2630 family protein [Acidimicrobiales bacterium]|nr:MAG: hypothetical protein B7Z69_02625 [Actinobacteria bacterium 21-73-9]HQU25467.1 DUF2630 family protein [Acidimicrobiales bacterium]